METIVTITKINGIETPLRAAFVRLLQAASLDYHVVENEAATVFTVFDPFTMMEPRR